MTNQTPTLLVQCAPWMRAAVMLLQSLYFSSPPPKRAIIPDARPLGTFEIKIAVTVRCDIGISKQSHEKIGDCEQHWRRTAQESPPQGISHPRQNKMLMPEGQTGGRLGAAGIDWCINVTDHKCSISILSIFDTVFRYLPIFLTVFRCWVPPDVPLKRSIVWKRGAKWRSFVISSFTQTSLGCLLEHRGPESEIF